MVNKAVEDKIVEINVNINVIVEEKAAVIEKVNVDKVKVLIVINDNLVMIKAVLDNVKIFGIIVISNDNFVVMKKNMVKAVIDLVLRVKEAVIDVNDDLMIEEKNAVKVDV